MGFFDISSILIGITIGAAIVYGIHDILPSWYKHYIYKKREKKAFINNVKSVFGLYEKLWENYSKEGGTLEDWAIPYVEIMDKFIEQGQRLVNLECPPEIPYELFDKLSLL